MDRLYDLSQEKGSWRRGWERAESSRQDSKAFLFHFLHFKLSRNRLRLAGGTILIRKLAEVSLNHRNDREEGEWEIGGRGCLRQIRIFRVGDRENLGLIIETKGKGVGMAEGDVAWNCKVKCKLGLLQNVRRKVLSGHPINYAVSYFTFQLKKSI